MRFPYSVLVLVLVLGSRLPASAGEEPAKPPDPPAPAPAPDPAAEAALKYLEEAKNAWFSANRSGMKAFTADLKAEADDLDEAGEGRMKKLLTAETVYAWNEGGEEEIAPIQGKNMQGLHKVLLERIKGMWRGIAGEPFGAAPEGAAASLKAGEAETEVAYTRNGVKVKSLKFDPKTKLPRREESTEGARTIAVDFSFVKVGENQVVSTIRRTVDKENQIADQSSWVFENFREVNGRPLPTSILADRNGKPIRIRLTYTTINGSPAQVKEAGKADEKNLASILSKAFGGRDVLEKQAAIKAAKDVGTETAAGLLSKYIGDPDCGIEVAKALGSMGKKSAVPPLIAAMEASKKNAGLFEAVCAALGQIGDPRAVKPLANNIWSGVTSAGWGPIARARVGALGEIRDKTSVDELIDMLEGTRWGHQEGLRGDVFAALAKLTGQRFRGNYLEAKDWWKKNRETYKF